MRSAVSWLLLISPAAIIVRSTTQTVKGAGGKMVSDKLLPR